jgi:hypothetical protein
MDENQMDEALRRRVAQLSEAIDRDGPRRAPLDAVLAGATRPAAARSDRPVHRGIRTSLAPGLAAAGVVVVVLAIVVSGLVQQKPTPRLTPTTPATPSPTLIPVTDARAKVIARGPNLGGVRWAPDGKTLALLDDAGLSQDAVTHFFDRAGNGLGQVEGGDLAWIDSSRFILLRWLEPTDQGVPAEAFVGRIGEAALSEIPGTYGQIAVGNGRGAVALTLSEPNQYVVWSNGKLSAPQSGVPMGWSNDGSELALIHPDADGQWAWPEIVGPSGQRLAANEAMRCSVGGLAMLFSPDGGRIALSDCLAGSQDVPFILSVATGASVSLGTQSVASLAWAGNARLYTVPVDPTERVLNAWDVQGGPVAIPHQAADRVSVSISGTAAVTSESAQFGGAGVLVLLETPSMPIELPGSPFSEAVWSPDGAVAVVTCALSDGSIVALMIRP